MPADLPDGPILGRQRVIWWARANYVALSFCRLVLKPLGARRLRKSLPISHSIRLDSRQVWRHLRPSSQDRGAFTSCLGCGPGGGGALLHGVGKSLG